MSVELCACGSALRAVRCCVSDPTQWPGPEAVALLDQDATRATELFNKKQYGEAEALALKILDAAPNHRVGLRVLFELRKAQKRVRAADALGTRLAGLPGQPAQKAQANGLYAQYLIARNEYARALPFAAAAVKAAPRGAAAHHALGVVYTETGALSSGEHHYRQALSVGDPQDGMVLANLAWNLKCQGRLREALTLYDKALAIRPDNSRGIGGKAQVLFAMGDRRGAEEVLASARERWPEDRFLRMLSVMATLAAQRPQAALDQLGAPEALLPAELLIRGQAFMQLGQPALALTSIATARTTQRERSGITFQSQALQDRLDRYKAYFKEGQVRPLPRAAQPAAFTPVFLLGFPRAGTGLLEQLLAQVQGVAVGDSMAPLADMVPALSALLGGEYPEALDNLLIGDGVELPTRLRGLYEAARQQQGLVRPQTRFVTDRCVSNAWHLGLIKLLYPEAPIIHVLRHPYDLMLSNIAQDKKLEADAQIGLHALARYFDLHGQMLKHYRGQLTLRYLPVRYEELVADPQGVVARVLAFIGADVPVPEGLAANTGPVPEPWPAHFALREAVHQRAAGRFKTYLTALPILFQEITSLLDPWVRELGYEEPTP